MKEIFLTLTTLLSICTNRCSGQASFYSANKRIVEQWKVVLQESWCKDYESSKVATPKQIKNLGRTISILNDFYVKDSTLVQVNQKLKEIKYKGDLKGINLGGFTKYTIQLPFEDNLRAYISFSIIGDKIVYKRISFDTETKTICKNSMIYILQDIFYVEKYCIPLINFPIIFNFPVGPIVSDTTLSQYRIPNSDSVDINKITWFSYDTYNREHVYPEIKVLVKRKDIDILQKLLYSENHILALYAMESLIYLKKFNLKYELESEQKMNAIKAANIPINWQTFDIVRSNTLYKDLNISTQIIDRKFNKP